MAKKLSSYERREWLKYRKPGCSSIHRCKTNELNVSPANSKDHEQAKFSLFYDLRKEGHKILTEAEEIKTGLRRDLVDISTGETYEIETSMRRAKRFIGEPVNIVAVGWSLHDEKWVKLLK